MAGFLCCAPSLVVAMIEYALAAAKRNKTVLRRSEVPFYQCNMHSLSGGSLAAGCGARCCTALRRISPASRNANLITAISPIMNRTRAASLVSQFEEVRKTLCAV